MIAIQNLEHIAHLHKLDITKELDRFIERHRKISEIYCKRLNDVSGIKLHPSLPADVKYNHAYSVTTVGDYLNRYDPV